MKTISYWLRQLVQKFLIQNDYRALLDDLAEEAFRLLYQIEALASIHLRGRIDETVDLQTVLFHLRRIMGEKIFQKLLKL